MVGQFEVNGSCYYVATEVKWNELCGVSRFVHDIHEFWNGNRMLESQNIYTCESVIKNMGISNAGIKSMTIKNTSISVIYLWFQFTFC